MYNISKPRRFWKCASALLSATMLAAAAPTIASASVSHRAHARQPLVRHADPYSRGHTASVSHRAHARQPLVRHADPYSRRASA